ncbi:MAG: hypothetical protein B6U72_06485 [Candidatus Altiarchaeales archaeon ex4484_2]|nr:MAG: hypothetical protein B6U72_06485 [Candidatus Altiarchaeales archaeon ex4484_2]
MKTRGLLTILILILLVGGASGYKTAVGGKLEINGKPAPDGIKVEARVDDKTIAESTTKQGAYMLSIENAQDFMYKKVGIYVNNNKASETIVSTKKFMEKNIQVNTVETTTSSTTTTTSYTTTTTERETGVVGMMVAFSVSNMATILGLLILLLIFVSIVREHMEKKDAG